MSGFVPRLLVKECRPCLSRDQRQGQSSARLDVAYPEATRGARTLSETIRGGGRVGSSPWFGYRVTWPLACLSVAPDSLTLSMWPVTYRFERSSLRCLLKKRLFGWPSLFIVHTNPAFSKSVVFQPLRFSRLESLLTQNGYLLTEQEPDLSTAEPIRYSTVIPAIAYIAAIVGVIALIVGLTAAGIGIGIAVRFIGRK